jgi:hypothetical protein
MLGKSASSDLKNKDLKYPAPENELFFLSAGIKFKYSCHETEN